MQVFQWFFVAIIGALVGTIAGYIAQTVRMPASLSIGLGVLGALLGAGLTLMTSFDGFGLLTFYVAGTIVSIGISAGAILAYTLTSSERRV